MMFCDDREADFLKEVETAIGAGELLKMHERIVKMQVGCSGPVVMSRCCIAPLSACRPCSSTCASGSAPPAPRPPLLSGRC